MLLAKPLSTGAQPSLEKKETGHLVCIEATEASPLPYRLYLPEVESEPLPLLVFLHGAGERGSRNHAQLKHGLHKILDPDRRARHPCIILAPQCPYHKWWGGSVLEQLFETIDTVIDSYAVDTNRIYITGLSMGGYGTWFALYERPHFFAAAIPLCGGGSPERAATFNHVPVWAWHGAQDQLFPSSQSRNLVEAMLKAGATDARYSEIPDAGHHIWDDVYTHDPLWEWLFQQHKER